MLGVQIYGGNHLSTIRLFDQHRRAHNSSADAKLGGTNFHQSALILERIPLERLPRRVQQDIPRLRHAASDNKDMDIEQPSNTCESKTEQFACLLKYINCERVSS